MKAFKIIADSWTFRSHFIMEDVKECQLQLFRVGSLLWYFSVEILDYEGGETSQESNATRKGFCFVDKCFALTSLASFLSSMLFGSTSAIDHKKRRSIIELLLMAIIKTSLSLSLNQYTC